MKISAKQIKEASKCFRYFNLLKKEKISYKEDRQILVVNDVIQKSYITATETLFKPEWKRIIGWVDKKIFSNIDIDNEDSFEASKVLSEHCLSFLNKWYTDIFLPENLLAYPSLTLDCSIDNFIVSTNIPIVKLLEVPVILSVDNVSQSNWYLYNDLEARIQAWLVSDLLKCEDIAYQRLTMGSRGGFEQTIIYFNSKSHNNTKVIVKQILKSISSNMNFPSITNECEVCTFYKRCTM